MFSNSSSWTAADINNSGFLSMGGPIRYLSPSKETCSPSHLPTLIWKFIGVLSFFYAIHFFPQYSHFTPYYKYFSLIPNCVANQHNPPFHPTLAPMCLPPCKNSYGQKCLIWRGYRYQPICARGTRSPTATPHRLQHLTARLIQNGRQGLERE